MESSGDNVVDRDTCVTEQFFVYFNVIVCPIFSVHWTWLSWVFCKQIRPDRQTLYWSATWPKEVEFLARQFLIDPYKVRR